MPDPNRAATLERLGVTPPVWTVVRSALDAAIATAERRPDRSVRPISALDAGCGRVSQLRPFRGRIGRLVGADIHAPTDVLPYLDEFVRLDLCGSADAFPPGAFDIVLASFALEHVAEPSVAIVNLRHWLAPGGTLVMTTVNRRHPFVAAYLGLPTAIRDRLQRVIKATAADAHPLVGACNDPATIADSLAAAGFVDIELTTVGHLARAWDRTWPTFWIGLVGDLLVQGLPSRRSTIVAVARA